METNTRSNRGRKHIPTEKRHKNAISIRLTDREFNALRSRAKEMNLSASALLRLVLKDFAEKEQEKGGD